MGASVFERLDAMGFELDSAVFFPAAWMSGNPVFVVKEFNAALIRLEDDVFSDKPGWNRIGVAIEVHTKVFVHFEASDVPALGQIFRKWPECQWIKANDGPLTCCAVDPYIGNVISPVIDLLLQILQVIGFSKGPEVLFDVTDTALFEILSDGFSADTQPSGDHPIGIALVVQAVNIEYDAFVDHRQLSSASGNEST